MPRRTGLRSIQIPSVLICLSAAAVARVRGAEASPDAVANAVTAMQLPRNENAKAEHVVDRYRQMEKQAYDAMLLQMNAALTPDQFQTFKRSVSAPPAAVGGAAAAPMIEGAGATRVPVTITEGHDTDPRDRGRPVVLIAAALNVPDEVFRRAFSGVHPAGPGQQPQEADVRQNKRVLLDALEPFGVDDDRLNEVSNYYRYSKSRGQMWRTTPAKVDAIVRNGKITGFVITDPGAGYSTPPTINVDGFPESKATAKLKFGTDLDSNGSLESVTLSN